MSEPRYVTVIPLDEDGRGGDNIFVIKRRGWGVLNQIDETGEQSAQFLAEVDATQSYGDAIAVVRRWFRTEGGPNA